jgi:hypothetical protein
LEPRWAIIGMMEKNTILGPCARRGNLKILAILKVNFNWMKVKVNLIIYIGVNLFFEKTLFLNVISVL